MNIKNFKVHDEVLGFYILSKVELKTSVRGPYLDIEISDATGSIPGKVWNYDGPISVKTQGLIVKVAGIVAGYKGNRQLVVSKIRESTDSDKYDINEIIPSAPVDTDDMKKQVITLIESLQDEEYKNVCKEVFDRNQSEFLSIPAAKAAHHAFLHGLLMHTGRMMKLADYVASIYGDSINRSLLIAGAFLHDIGKIKEFTLSEYGLVKEYSVKGNLMGHLVLGAQEVAEVCKDLNITEEKSIMIQHMLLSHHGNPEWGAAVVPKCLESEVLSLIDLIDARAEVYIENYDNMRSGEFSYIKTLGHTIFKF